MAPVRRFVQAAHVILKATIICCSMAMKVLAKVLHEVTPRILVIIPVRP